jgi:predicted metal-dependent hydrolase
MTKHFTLVYGDARIPYRVVKVPTRASRVAIHVDPDGSVTVDAPVGFPDEAVQKAVQKRARWITTHVTEANHRHAQVRPREYISGEQVLYLGRRYMLKVVPTDQPTKLVRLRGNKLEVQTKSGNFDEIRGRVRAWYRTKARDYFAHRLAHLSDALPWINEAPRFRLLEMSRQWGSCAPTGQIILNPHLVKTPRHCVDYVIVHELAHHRHHNHSQEFFRLLNTIVPDWQSHKRVLDGMVEVVMND